RQGVESCRDDISDSNPSPHNGQSPSGTTFQIAKQLPGKELSHVGTTFQIAKRLPGKELSHVGTTFQIAKTTRKMVLSLI
ncbi:MAG: hypothetical protein PHY24_08585, partial [Candidatus Cloacimonetes bacterium]|nr:hypothetical protein [Candidatus Cloacimonadota bacterium]